MVAFHSRYPQQLYRATLDVPFPLPFWLSQSWWHSVHTLSIHTHNIAHKNKNGVRLQENVYRINKPNSPELHHWHWIRLLPHWGLYSLNSYRKNPLSLEAARLDVIMTASFWNLASYLGSAAAEVPVKLHSDWKSSNPDLAASRLYEILW